MQPGHICRLHFALYYIKPLGVAMQAIAIYLILLVYGCQSNEESSDNNDNTFEKEWKPSAPAVLVKTETVQTGSVANYIEITGSLESISQVNIIPETTGTVQEIFVREGDPVEIGSPLAQLINPNVSASLERSNIELQRLTQEFTKTKQLHAQGAVSDRDLQQAQTALQTATASHTEANATNKNTTIRSPIKGLVASVNLRQGELATTTQVFQIVEPNHLRLVASVPEKDLQYLQTEQSVQIFASYNDEQTVSGFIERIAPVVDPTSGSVKVFVNLEEGQTLLRPGQFVKGKVQVDVHENTLVVPKTALVYEDGSAVVYVLTDAPQEEQMIEKNADSTENSSDTHHKEEKEHTRPSKPKAKYTASRRIVELGYTDYKWAEIISGVTLHENVITIGNSNIEDGSPVNIESKMPVKDNEPAGEK